MSLSPDSPSVERVLRNCCPCSYDHLKPCSPRCLCRSESTGEGGCRHCGRLVVGLSEPSLIPGGEYQRKWEAATVLAHSAIRRGGIDCLWDELRFLRRVDADRVFVAAVEFYLRREIVQEASRQLANARK